MSIFPKKISWTEPWDWEVRKERIRQGYKELYKNWVLFLILFAVSVAIGACSRISKQINNIEAQESLTCGQIVIAIAIPFFGYGVLFLCFPCLFYVFPQGIQVTEKGVFFQTGNSASRIDVKDIISLSFETRDGRRYFVVKARDKKGLPHERLALMAKKGVTEENVRRFLYDVNLAHLYVGSKGDTREATEGFRQDLQDLQD